MSIGLSCFATSYTTTTITFDLDTHPTRRADNPEIYGFVPDDSKGRIFVFLLLFVVHATQTICKSVALSLLAETKGFWLLGYIAADWGLYLAYKALRGDLIYWVPGFGTFSSLLIRILLKALVDITGCIHFRHPCEQGGAHYTANVAMSQLSVFVAVGLYSLYHDGSDHIESGRLFGLAGGVFVLWGLAFGGLLLMFKPGYAKSFLSSQTGCNFSKSYFLNNADDDKKRSIIFQMNQVHWQPIRKDVRQWVQANRVVWEADKPVWFTDAFVASIPDDIWNKEADSDTITLSDAVGVVLE